MSINETLNSLVGYLSEHTQLHVTRNPATVNPPCVFVDNPTIENTTMAGVVINVPVWLIAEGQGGLESLTWLLENVVSVMELLPAETADPQPFKDTMPAYRASVQILVK